MNVGFVHSVGALGGAERVTLSLLEQLSSSGGGDHCLLFCPKPSDLSSIAEDNGVRCFDIRPEQASFSSPWQFFSQAVSQYKIIKRNNIDLLHTGDPLAFKTIIPAARAASVPVICHVHFPYEPSFVRWTLGRKLAATAFVFCSNELKNSLGGLLADVCPNASHHVIHNGVDTEKFRAGPVPFRNPHIRIGIVANLQRRKGHDDFLVMASQLCERYSNLQFDIYGGDILGDPREPLLQNLAQTLGISDRVHFHGQVDDVSEPLRRLDILVCASHEEAFPLSILEAMASSRPIVATNVNGIPEAVDSDLTGLLVPPRRPELMTEAVSKLIENPDKARRFGNDARNVVENQFSLNRFYEQFDSLYKAIVNR